MTFYGQDAEVEMLRSFIPLLAEPTVVDVGAELGEFTAALLDAGAEAVYAIEPHPGNVQALRSRFGDDERVTVLEYAASDEDGPAELHVASTNDGVPVSYAHSLIDLSDVADVAWDDTVRVERRSLASLVASGALPRRVGIVKVDTEGHDLSVLRGLGDLEADIVMCEHWTNLPNLLGPCPWSLEDVVATMRPRGFSNYVIAIHDGEFEAMKWNDGDVPEGASANLVFFSDRVLGQTVPIAFRFANGFAQKTIDAGKMYAEAATERLALIQRLDAHIRGAQATGGGIARRLRRGR